MRSATARTTCVRSLRYTLQRFLQVDLIVFPHVLQVASVLYLWHRESDCARLEYPAQRPICCPAWCTWPATSDACHGDPFNVSSHLARQGRGSQSLSRSWVRIAVAAPAHIVEYIAQSRDVCRKSALAQTVLAVPMPVVEYITRACAVVAARTCYRAGSNIVSSHRHTTLAGYAAPAP